jgi:hypothetical protein
MLQFRFELYNVLNHTNLGILNLNPNSGSFGDIANANDQSIIQVTLRFIL